MNKIIKAINDIAKYQEEEYLACEIKLKHEMSNLKLSSSPLDLLMTISESSFNAGYASGQADAFKIALNLIKGEK